MPSRFRDLFPFPQRIAYLSWFLLGKPCPISLTLKTGQTLYMRRDSPIANDHDTAYEVFVNNFYRPDGIAPGDQMLNIVDLGANVGYATMYFAHLFPKSHLYCFEPHPTSFAELVANLRRNHLLDRATLYKAAASNVMGSAFLTDDAVCSTIVSSDGDRRFRVTQLDLFECLRDVNVDILKVDIEGGEYAILGDDRFRQLLPSSVMMEWHSDQEHGDGKLWCVRRLESLGYQVTIRWDGGAFGAIAAVRPKDSLNASLS
jgi:FkbM family methyltransferase